MELRIKKDGRVYLMGKEVGKAPHTLEKVKKLVIVMAGKPSLTFDFIVPEELNELGLDVFVE